MTRYLTVYAALEALALAALLALSTGCAAPAGPFAAMSEGSRLADGGGECGAVALDAHHALTAAHCAGAGMEYFAPGESEGRPVRAVYANKRLDIACVEVETGETGRAIGDLFEGAELTAEANVSGVVTGRAADSWTVELPSQQGDSGSAVYDAAGALVGIVLGSAEDGVESTTQTRLGSARQAAELCATR